MRGALEFWCRPPPCPLPRRLRTRPQVGGLADVVSSLAKAHQASGLLTEVILPKYDCIQYGELNPAPRCAAPGVAVRRGPSTVARA